MRLRSLQILPEKCDEIGEGNPRGMLIGWIRRDAVFLREGSVRTLAETVAGVRFTVLVHLETDWKLPLQPFELFPWTDAIGTIADREQLRATGCQPVTRLGDITVADI